MIVSVAKALQRLGKFQSLGKRLFRFSKLFL
ncbi:hypothetical protein SMU58_07663 [Streptococcus mutans A19]|nr:hypothetical protein SMU40_03615 [Streptococcus mutans 15VF2]EMB78111.1 hypothetical protein SMU44_07280 [Streptococcus mutans 11VS1]EMB84775.1 hypothetical protein SMU54_06573 [Streptococcus mutans A9]EMB90183.1 hypothetical protein SMU58_07663 [Streptococcus mutans A19]EMB95855.1 hypothetical protein SMU60_00670 [Streptococcus mutans U138]